MPNGSLRRLTAAAEGSSRGGHNASVLPLSAGRARQLTIPHRSRFNHLVQSTNILISACTAIVHYSYGVEATLSLHLHRTARLKFVDQKTDRNNQPAEHCCRSVAYANFHYMNADVEEKPRDAVYSLEIFLHLKRFVLYESVKENKQITSSSRSKCGDTTKCGAGGSAGRIAIGHI